MTHICNFKRQETHLTYHYETLAPHGGYCHHMVATMRNMTTFSSLNIMKYHCGYAMKHRFVLRGEESKSDTYPIWIHMNLCKIHMDTSVQIQCESGRPVGLLTTNEVLSTLRKFRAGLGNHNSNEGMLTV